MISRSKPNAAQKAWQKAVRERDDYQCQWPLCTYRDLYIHVHHICPRSQRPDLKLVVSNGVCLCAKHHDYAHYHSIGRQLARQYGLLGGPTYELARKEQAMTREKKTTAETEKEEREKRNARKQKKQKANKLTELKSAVVKSPGRAK